MNTLPTSLVLDHTDVSTATLDGISLWIFYLLINWFLPEDYTKDLDVDTVVDDLTLLVNFDTIVPSGLVLLILLGARITTQICVMIMASRQLLPFVSSV